MSERRQVLNERKMFRTLLRRNWQELFQQRRGMGGQRPEAVREQAEEYDAGEGACENKGQRGGGFQP